MRTFSTGHGEWHGVTYISGRPQPTHGDSWGAMDVVFCSFFFPFSFFWLHQLHACVSICAVVVVIGWQVFRLITYVATNTRCGGC